MNEIQTFSNNHFGTIRAVRDEDGEPMFVAKDVCAVLELKNRARPSLFSTRTRRGSTLWTPLAASSR